MVTAKSGNRTPRTSYNPRIRIEMKAVLSVSLHIK